MKFQLVNPKKVLIFFFAFAFGIFSFIPLTGITIIIRAITLALCLLFVLIEITNKNKTIINQFNLFLVFFLFLYSLRLYEDATSNLYNFEMSNIELLMRFIIMAWIPLLTISLLNVNKIDKKIALYSLLSIIAFSLISSFIFGYKYRLSGNDVLNPITLGYYAGILVLLLITQYKINLFNIFLIIISLIVLILTLSRGALLSLLIILILNLKLNIKSYIIIGILSFLVIFITISIDSSIIFNRLNIDFGQNGNDGEARVILWYLAFKNILNNFLFGISTTTEIGYVHNIYLESLMSIGIFGFVFLLIPVSRVLLMTFKDRNNCIENLFASYTILTCMFSGTVYNSEFFWVFVPLALNNISFSKIYVSK